MVSWVDLVTLPHDSLENLYKVYVESNISIADRKKFADWFETNHWENLENFSKNSLYKTFISLLESSAQSLEFPENINAKEHIQKYKNTYGNIPTQFADDVQDLLNMENEIYRSFQNLTKGKENFRMNIQLQPSPSNTEILDQGIEELKNYIKDVKNRAWLLSTGDRSNTKRVKIDADELQKHQQVAEKNFVAIHERLPGLVSLWREELSWWKYRQQLAQNGEKVKDNIDIIEKWLEDLLDINHSVKDLLESIYQNNIEISRLFADIDSFQKVLIENSFVLEKQPKQIIVKKNQFSASVRWLAGRKICQIHNLQEPEIECSLINDKCDPGLGDKNCGQLSGHICKMNKQDGGNPCIFEFKKLMLKDYKRKEKASINKNVATEKYALFFKSTLRLSPNFTISPSVFSVAVVILTHTSQTMEGMPVIGWDNQFAGRNRRSFDVPQSVKCSDLIHMLSLMFATETDAGLSPAHCRYLRQRLLKCSNGNTDDDVEVTWDQFYKDPLDDNNFTFWAWIYHCMKLIKDYFKDLWVQNHIVGFISKPETEEMLLKHQVGTFLLRFSEQKQGGISSVVVQLSKKGKKKCNHYFPFDAEILQIQGLAAIICGTEEYVNLYPSIPKQDAFQYTSKAQDKCEKQTLDGYINYEMASGIKTLKMKESDECQEEMDQQGEYDDIEPEDLSLLFTCDSGNFLREASRNSPKNVSGTSTPPSVSQVMWSPQGEDTERSFCLDQFGYGI